MRWKILDTHSVHCLYSAIPSTACVKPWRDVLKPDTTSTPRFAEVGDGDSDAVLWMDA